MAMSPRRVLLLAVAASCVAACGSGQGAPASSSSGSGLVAIGAGLMGRSGLHATVYATGLKAVGSLAFDDTGRLWAGTAAYTDGGADGVYVVNAGGGSPQRVLSNARTPLGLLWVQGSLYVASHASVTAYSGFAGAAFTATRSVLTLPSNIGEDNNLVLAPDGHLLMGISAPCDHCTPDDAMSGAVVSFLPDGSALHVYASKIRAPVGLTFVPGIDELLVTMNQRDDLGAQTPGDWLAVVQPGQSWGFPSCWGQASPACANVPRPLAVLDKHAAVSGVAVAGSSLSRVSGSDEALVAEWSDGVVKAVTLATTSAGRAGTASTYLSGLQRPVPLVIGPDGALYVGDWGSGTIYRIAPA